MKRVILTACTAVFLIACNSDDKKTEEPKVASSSDEKKEWVAVDSAAMQKMMELGAPAEEHAMLAKSNGTWVGETTMWKSAGAEPMKSTATSVNEMIMGGRYQRSTFSGDMGGMPFEGTGITGYDRAKKKYTSVWVDNMSTSMMNMEGIWDDATKSINFSGKMICSANNMEMEMREVFKFIDDNTHIMEMYAPDMTTGKEYKTLEIKFTRKK